MESLCIRSINSYSSSVWHPGNRRGFALGLIFRPTNDSQSIRVAFGLWTTNFTGRVDKEKENEKVIERAIDDLRAEVEQGQGRKREQISGA